MAEFDNIAVGDQVIVHSFPYGRRRTDAHIVEHVTKIKTQFTAGGIRFTKFGREVGGLGPWVAQAELATPERFAEVTRQTVAAAISRAQAITARVHEIARCGGVTVDDVASAAVYLQAAMEQLTPPDAAATQGGEVEG